MPEYGRKPSTFHFCEFESHGYGLHNNPGIDVYAPGWGQQRIIVLDVRVDVGMIGGVRTIVISPKGSGDISAFFDGGGRSDDQHHPQEVKILEAADAEEPNA